MQLRWTSCDTPDTQKHTNNKVDIFSLFLEKFQPNCIRNALLFPQVAFEMGFVPFRKTQKPNNGCHPFLCGTELL